MNQPKQLTATSIDPGCIGFDFDGVIADTAGAFLRIACEEYGFCDIDLEQITRFQVEECLDMDPVAVEAIFSAILHDSLGTGLQPMPGCQAVLEDISACGKYQHYYRTSAG